jgi:hypothetical protein
MEETRYADGVTDIVIVGPTARVRFHMLQPNADPKGPPQAQRAFTVVMPVEAVAQLSESLPKLIQQLLDSGRLKRRAAAPKPVTN